MAVFEITSPSGEIFEITAPEGASEQDVLSYAQSQFASQPTQPTQPSALQSTWEKIKAGNFPAAERFKVGYEQMPQYLQDPYLGLSAGTLGKVGAEMFPNVAKTISQTIPEKLMQSALKPTLKQLETGQASTAVKTMLEEGINPTQAGVQKIQSKIKDLNTQVANKIEASTGTVKKTDILKYLDELEAKKLKQVNPADDIVAIDKVKQEFMNFNKPVIKTPGQAIPVQLAQQLKQGTYSALAKKYGQMGSTEIEAQKTLARGLKEKVGEAVPEVLGLNKKEAQLIDTLDVVERRALMELNKNPGGLTWLSENPMAAAGFMADKSAVFKSLLARGLYNLNKGTSRIQGLLNKPQAARASGLLTQPTEE
jgi:predicted house-cleaning noncanonical NTP pyrophosphatase (MazG superfamily)